MLIKAIEFTNFRQFKDTRLVFSSDPEKNVTVILGDNTHGKTTIVRGFLWCLYRENAFANKMLINDEVVSSMVPGKTLIDVKVSVELEHGQYSYIITTKETYSKNQLCNLSVSTKAATTVLKTPKSGNTVTLVGDTATVEIEKILRKELAPYFFFDGENNKIDEVSAKSNLNQAITDILGLKKKETLMSYYNPKVSDNVINRFNNKLTSKNEVLALSLNADLEEAQNKFDKEEIEISGIDEEIRKLENQLDEKNKELDSVKSVIQEQQEKKELLEKLERARVARDSNFNAMISLLNKNDCLMKYLSAYYFINSDINGILKESSFSQEKTLSHIDEVAIDQIIARKYCICGEPIIPGNKAHMHLLEQKETIAPRNYGKATQDFIAFSEQNIDYSKVSFSDNVVEKANSTTSCIEDIDTAKERLKQIEERIAGKKDAGLIQEDIIRITGQKGHAEGRKEFLKNDLIGLGKRIEKLSEDINKNSAASQNNARISKCIVYSRYIFDFFTKVLELQKRDIRKRLEERVQGIFGQMYSGDRQINVDEGFKVTTSLTTGSKSKLDESKGLETVKNFAFVGGLISLAKENLILGEADEQNGDEDEKYPLVMDAPFSNCDENHILKICNQLPNLCNQVIIIVMKKDFKNSDSVIKDKVGKKYRICKDTEAYAHVEEE